MGRHSIYIKEAGFDVTACDISEKAVETTKKKLGLIHTLFMIDGTMSILLKLMCVLLKKRGGKQSDLLCQFGMATIRQQSI